MKWFIHGIYVIQISLYDDRSYSFAVAFFIDFRVVLFLICGAMEMVEVVVVMMVAAYIAQHQKNKYENTGRRKKFRYMYSQSNQLTQRTSQPNKHTDP